MESYAFMRNYRTSVYYVLTTDSCATRTPAVPYSYLRPLGIGYASADWAMASNMADSNLTTGFGWLNTELVVVDMLQNLQSGVSERRCERETV